MDTTNIEATCNVQVLLERHNVVHHDTALDDVGKEARMKAIADAFHPPESDDIETLEKSLSVIGDTMSTQGLHQIVAKRLFNVSRVIQNTLTLAAQRKPPEVSNLTAVLQMLNKPNKYNACYHLIEKGARTFLDEDVVERRDEEVSVIARNTPCAWSELRFSQASREKSTVAALVSGESGSGKTFLSTLLLQKKLKSWHDTAGSEIFFVRLCLSWETTGEIKALMRKLSSDTLSKDERNSTAIETMEALFRTRIDTPFVGKVKRLVLIVDEISACLNLAKGCIAAAVAAGDGDADLFSFAEHTFLIFCGTAVEFAAEENLDVQNTEKSPNEPSPAGSGRATTKLGATTTHPKRVVFIRLREASPEFYTSLYQGDATSEQRRILELHKSSSIMKTLMTNCRAGISAVMHLLENPNATSTDILRNVAKAYSASNGIAALFGTNKDHAVIRKHIQSALKAVLTGNQSSPSVPSRRLCELGMLSKDYTVDRYNMSLAMLAMCLCEFGHSPAPAVDWGSFEHLCFSYEHLLAFAFCPSDSASISTMKLNQPFPLSSGDRVRLPKRLADAIRKLQPGDSLTVLNGDKAQFADVFSIHVTDEDVLLRLVQCKFLGPATCLQPATYVAELLKWSLRPKKTIPSKSVANEVARGFPQLVADDDMLLEATIVARAALEAIQSLTVKPLRIEPLFCLRCVERVSPTCTKHLDVVLLPFEDGIPEWSVGKVKFVDNLGPLNRLVEPSSPDEPLEDSVELRAKRKRTNEEGNEVVLWNWTKTKM